MIYRIVLDNTDIYGLTQDMEIISPSINIELNTAGTLSFSLPPFHKNYNSPKVLMSDVEVYEYDDLIWYGRIVEIDTSFNKNKVINCEGALAFFNDTIQRPQVYLSETTTVRSFFESVIAKHNSQVSAHRQFTVGFISDSIADKKIYRQVSYERTLDVINEMCLDAEGGYLFFRKENGINCIDWYADMPYHASQPIQFGLNLTDLTTNTDGVDICTSVIPLGTDSNNNYIDITSVNGGLDYLDSEATSMYGRVVQVVIFDNLVSPAEIMSAGQKWLEKQEIQPFSIECSAAELNYLDSSYKTFKVGQNVHVVSSPHLIDTYLPLNKMQINLDSAVKKISVGTQAKKELTEIYGNSSSSTSANTNVSTSAGTNTGSANTGSTSGGTNTGGTSTTTPYSTTLILSDDNGLDASSTEYTFLNGAKLSDFDAIEVLCTTRGDRGNGVQSYSHFTFSVPILQLKPTVHIAEYGFRWGMFTVSDTGLTMSYAETVGETIPQYALRIYHVYGIKY